MLDRNFIVENAEAVQQNCINRGIEVDVAQFVRLDTRLKEIQAEVDDLNRQANQVSKAVGKAKDGNDREALKEKGRRLRARTLEVGSQLRRTR